MGPSSSAVDLPRPRVELELGRRRHRRITVPSGLVLFLCLFLPAVKGCNEPVYPITLPMLWHPYLYAVVIAVGTLFPTVRSIRRTVIALRVLAWLTILGSAALATFAGAIAFLELLAGGVLLAAIGR